MEGQARNRDISDETDSKLRYHLDICQIGNVNENFTP
nr:MAG TPA: hypothetical protein [Caudoviricetes sp.]